MSQKTRHFYAFGPFHLDARECLLILDGKPVPLAPKAFEALLMLVENAGHLVDKDDLMRRLWPDTFVEEANVAKHVSLLRKILSEATNGREYIETIPKRGYRFVVDDLTGDFCTRWNERESTWRKSWSCQCRGTSQSKS
jgi:DNA-binding winged helix-turn-helix (wHTH) protein